MSLPPLPDAPNTPSLSASTLSTQAFGFVGSLSQATHKALLTTVAVCALAASAFANLAHANPNSSPTGIDPAVTQALIAKSATVLDAIPKQVQQYKKTTSATDKIVRRDRLAEQQMDLEEALKHELPQMYQHLHKAGFYQKAPANIDVLIQFDSHYDRINAFAAADPDKIQNPIVGFALPQLDGYEQHFNTLAHPISQMERDVLNLKDLPTDPKLRADQNPNAFLSTAAFLKMTALHEIAHIEHAYQEHYFDHPQLPKHVNHTLSTQIVNDTDYANKLIPNASSKDPSKPSIPTHQEILDQAHHEDARNGSVSRLVAESYADAHMALTYLKLHGNNAKTLQDLAHFSKARQHNSAFGAAEHRARAAITPQSHSGTRIDAYRTHDAINFVIQNAAVLEKIPTQNVSQAAGFIASAYSHALLSSLPDDPTFSNRFEKAYNANALQTLNRYAPLMDCSDCGVNTKALLQYAMYPHTAPTHTNTTPIDTLQAQLDEPYIPNAPLKSASSAFSFHKTSTTTRPSLPQAQPLDMPDLPNATSAPTPTEVPDFLKNGTLKSRIDAQRSHAPSATHTGTLSFPKVSFPKPH